MKKSFSRSSLSKEAIEVNSVYIEKEIMENIQELPLNYRKQVLDFVRALRLSEPTGISGNKLLKFANSINKDDLLRISQAIEENCELN